MYTRRDVLQTTAAGTALSAGGLLGSSTAVAEDAPFGDGVNLQPSYYCGGTQDLGWELMAQYPAIQTVRIEIEPPEGGETQSELSDKKRWIDEASEHGYDVIATYHHHPNNGAGDPQALQDAAEWWVEHYDYFAEDAEFTINLMNEWGDHQVTASDYATAYNEAIETVRSGTDYTGPIVVDVPGWGGNTHVAAEAATDLEDDDLIVSTHVYPGGWNATTGEYLSPEHLDPLTEIEYPCTVGEFGDNGDAEGDWSAVVDRANELGWPVIGWAWNGGGGGMHMAAPSWGEGCSAPYTESDYFDTIYEKLEDGAEAPDAPTIEGIDFPEGDEAWVNWSAVEDADEYSVFLDDELQTTTSDTAATVQGISYGTYTVGVRAENAAGASDLATRSFSIDPPPCNGAADTAVLENGQLVCDVDGDGQYRDVTGDGSVTNSDVTEFFRNQHTSPWDDRADLFDFTGDDAVSQADVIELFQALN